MNILCVLVHFPSFSPCTTFLSMLLLFPHFPPFPPILHRFPPMLFPVSPIFRGHPDTWGFRIWVHRRLAMRCAVVNCSGTAHVVCPLYCFNHSVSVQSGCIVTEFRSFFFGPRPGVSHTPLHLQRIVSAWVHRQHHHLHVQRPHCHVFCLHLRRAGYGLRLPVRHHRVRHAEPHPCVRALLAVAALVALGVQAHDPRAHSRVLCRAARGRVPRHVGNGRAAPRYRPTHPRTHRVLGCRRCGNNAGHQWLHVRLRGT